MAINIIMIEIKNCQNIDYVVCSCARPKLYAQIHDYVNTPTSTQWQNTERSIEFLRLILLKSSNIVLQLLMMDYTVSFELVSAQTQKIVSLLSNCFQAFFVIKIVKKNLPAAKRLNPLCKQLSTFQLWGNGGCKAPPAHI